MSRDEAVLLWLAGARKSLRAANTLAADQNNELALFHCHLCAEKTLKALYVFEEDAAPPLTHDLATLVIAIGQKHLQEQFDEFASMSKFAIAARYDDIDVLEQDLTQERIRHWLLFTDSLLCYAEENTR